MRHARPLIVSLLAAALSTALPAAAQDTASAQRPEVAAAGKAVQQQVVDWRRHFHQYPELSNREEQTAKRVAEELRKLGLQPRTGIAHHGVTAVIKGGKPGPRIALRADMDALPVTERNELPFASKATATYRGETVGVMHACGHDAHTGILLGVAKALVAMQDQLPGEVLLVFQPAEEGAPAGEEGGASLMLAEGVFKDFKPEAVFGLHVFSSIPVGQIGVRQGPLMAASDSFTLKVVGRQTHGSRPWDGVDPITLGAQILLGTQSMIARQVNIATSPVVLTAGQFQAGVRFNIIPDEAKLVGTLRTFDPAVREDVIARFRRIATDYAHASEGTAELQVANNAPATINQPALTQRVRPSLEKAVGAANVVEMPLVTVAEDFSQFANTVPGFYFFVGSTSKGIDPATAPINHSPQFLLDEQALETGSKAMLQVALDYLGTPR